MSENRWPPDDPREWLNRAKSNLFKARATLTGIYLEDLCFDTQQAAEKAVKAVLIYSRKRFPHVHDLTELLTLVQDAGIAIPDTVKKAVRLNRFAVVTRYPGISEPVTLDEYKDALSIAEDVYRWAESIIETENN